MKKLLFLILLPFLSAAQQVKIVRDRITQVYSADTIPAWNVQVSGISSQHTVKWRINTTHWKIDSGAVALSAPGQITAGYTPVEPGWGRLYVQLFNASNQIVSKDSITFSLYTGKKSTGEKFRYGLAAHTANLDSAKQVQDVELIRKLGVDIIRGDIATWSDVEPTKGNINYSKPDRFFRMIANLGLQVNQILDYSVSWAVRPGYATNYKSSPPVLSDWLNYVRRTVSRYKDRVKFWEIWNEADSEFWKGSSDEYAQLYNATAAEIRKIDPSLKIMNSGWAGGKLHPVEKEYFMFNVARKIDPALIDIWAYHNYSSQHDLRFRQIQLDTVFAHLPANVEKWVNEGGASAILFGAQVEQAYKLVKCILLSMKYNSKAYMWYNLRNDGPNRTNYEQNFGLTDVNGDPFLAYTGYQHLIATFPNPQYVPILEKQILPTGVEAYYYKTSPTKAVIAIWNESTPGTNLYLRGITVTKGSHCFGGHPGTTGFQILGNGARIAAGVMPLFIEVVHSETAPCTVTLTLQ